MIRESYLRDDLTPFELYMKFLIEYFGPAIEYDPNAESDLPKGYKNLSYQTDAVNDGWLKLQKHSGFFLADVVGLGKTVVAARIAKKFYYYNGFPTHRSRILVIVPPAMKEPWQTALDKFNIDDSARVVTNGSLHKIKPAEAEKFDLIIVDEAHKFRNDTAGSYTLLQKLCKTRTRHRLPDGTFAAKKVILISATPLNNQAGRKTCETSCSCSRTERIRQLSATSNISLRAGSRSPGPREANRRRTAATRRNHPHLFRDSRASGYPLDGPQNPPRPDGRQAL